MLQLVNRGALLRKRNALRSSVTKCRNPTHKIVIELKALRPFLAGALVEVLPQPNDEGDPGAGYGNNGEVLEY
jgi:hypothetical protein